MKAEAATVVAATVEVTGEVRVEEVMAAAMVAAARAAARAVGATVVGSETALGEGHSHSSPLGTTSVPSARRPHTKMDSGS